LPLKFRAGIARNESRACELSALEPAPLSLLSTFGVVVRLLLAVAISLITTLRLLFARQAKGKRKLVLWGFCNSDRSERAARSARAGIAFLRLGCGFRSSSRAAVIDLSVARAKK
jgi:hypothetical protein